MNSLTHQYQSASNDRGDFLPQSNVQEDGRSLVKRFVNSFSSYVSDYYPYSPSILIPGAFSVDDFDLDTSSCSTLSSGAMSDSVASKSRRRKHLSQFQIALPHRGRKHAIGKSKDGAVCVGYSDSVSSRDSFETAFGSADNGLVTSGVQISVKCSTTSRQRQSEDGDANRKYSAVVVNTTVTGSNARDAIAKAAAKAAYLAAARFYGDVNEMKNIDLLQTISCSLRTSRPGENNSEEDEVFISCDDLLEPIDSTADRARGTGEDLLHPVPKTADDTKDMIDSAGVKVSEANGTSGFPFADASAAEEDSTGKMEIPTKMETVVIQMATFRCLIPHRTWRTTRMFRPRQEVSLPGRGATVT